MKLYTLDGQFIIEKDSFPPYFTGISEFPDGVLIHYKDGQWHREDGPAYLHPNGLIGYYINSKMHRLDGPAYMDPVRSIEEWFICGIRCIKEEHSLYINLMKLKGLNTNGP